MLVACSPPSHYLNQCWHIVDWTPSMQTSKKSVKNINNPSKCWHQNILVVLVNTMAADALAPHITMPSTDMVLTMQGVQVLVFHNEGFQLPAPYPRAASRLASSQWETALQSNAVSHWLDANLESALISVSRNYRKCKYIFMFPQISSAWLWLTNNFLNIATPKANNSYFSNLNCQQKVS